MSEAIIAKRYKDGGSGGQGSSGTPTNSYFYSNNYYTCTRTGNYYVTCVGGGGGGIDPTVTERDYYTGTGWRTIYTYYGGNAGAPGTINTRIVRLNLNDEIFVSIGAGGAAYSSGATTSFGTYVSAAGGSAGGGYRGGVIEHNIGYSADYAAGGTGPYLYHTTNIANPVSTRETGNRTLYGDGGTGSSINVGFFGLNNSTPETGNSGFCIVRYAD